MSDSKEAFKTDIGHVEVDLKKKTVSVDGKPLHEVTKDTTLMELLIRDLSIDRELIMALRTNLTALKTWLPGIGNRQARETFRKFIEDSNGVLDGMAKQRNLMLISLAKMEGKWRQQQQPTVGTPTSTSDAPPTPSATDAPEALKSPETPAT